MLAEDKQWPGGHRLREDWESGDTWWSTLMLITLASLKALQGAASSEVGRNSSPVMKVLWAARTRRTRARFQPAPALSLHPAVAYLTCEDIHHPLGHGACSHEVSVVRNGEGGVGEAALARYRRLHRVGLGAPAVQVGRDLSHKLASGLRTETHCCFPE